MVFKRIFDALSGGEKPGAKMKPSHPEGQGQDHGNVSPKKGAGIPGSPALFEAFTRNYTPDPVRSDTPDASVQLTADATGWNEFFAAFSGCSFNNGLYRTHSSAGIENWNEIVASFFPAYANTILCFGYDWLGRQFALDMKRTEAGEPLVLMFDPIEFIALEIPSNFVRFHEFELLTHQTECLAPEYYEEWLDAGNTPLLHDQCAGFKVPLFLGGKDEVANLEPSDMEVNWVIHGQIMQQIRGG